MKTLYKNFAIVPPLKSKYTKKLLKEGLRNIEKSKKENKKLED